MRLATIPEISIQDTICLAKGVPIREVPLQAIDNCNAPTTPCRHL